LFKSEVKKEKEMVALGELKERNRNGGGGFLSLFLAPNFRDF